MKSLCLQLILLLGLCLASAKANDILANGDFTDGKAHWKGDVFDSSADTSSSPTDAQGLTVQLNGSKWTKVFQIFNTRESALDFSLTYKTSSDCSFKPVTQLTIADLFDVIGLRFVESLNTRPGNILIMMVDPAQNMMRYTEAKAVLGSPDPQAIKGTIPELVAHEEKTLYITLPPGTGTVTLLNVALNPSNATPK